MRTINKLKSWFSVNANAPSGMAHSCIVDVNRIAGTKSGQDRIPPRIQVQTLQRLARFAKKESVTLTAVVEGKELRAASHGGDYQGITVYFSEKSANLSDAMLQAFRNNTKALVVTDNKELESKIKTQGGQFMRLSTFKKGLDSGAGTNPGSQPRSSGSGNRRRRSSGGTKQRRSEKEKSETQTNEKKDPVSELIDLVE